MTNARNHIAALTLEDLHQETLELRLRLLKEALKGEKFGNDRGIRAQLAADPMNYFL